MLLLKHSKALLPDELIVTINLWECNINSRSKTMHGGGVGEPILFFLYPIQARHGREHKPT